ncbi:MAG: hypothetical protein RIS47_80 [Bacteroidota bacterium]
MCKKIVALYILCGILLTIPQIVVAQTDGIVAAKSRITGMMKEQPQDSTKRKTPFKPKVLPNEAFNDSEILKYEMHYGFIVGGRATATLTKVVLNGQTVLHAKGEAKTVGMADMLFKVYDVYESWFDAATNLPVKAIRNINEGRYKNYSESVFYQDRDSVYSSKLKAYSRVRSEIGIFDLVSAFYYARRVSFRNLKVGDVVQFNTFFDDKPFLLEVKFRGVEVIKTKFGKIRCLKFNPLVEPGRVFDTENDVIFWITDDKNFIPMRVQMNLMIGSFKTDLVEHKGLRNPLQVVK